MEGGQGEGERGRKGGVGSREGGRVRVGGDELVREKK